MAEMNPGLEEQVDSSGLDTEMLDMEMLNQNATTTQVQVQVQVQAQV